MSDKEILEEVHRRLGGTGSLGEKVRSFIEQEWQRRDEKDAKVAADEMMETATEIFGKDTTFSKHWYNKD